MKKWEKLSAFAIISGLGVIVYSNTFFSSFHFDDDYYIVNNPGITNIHNLFNILKIYPCRFVTFFSFFINYHYHQLNVFGYHLFNTIIHLGSAIFVYWLSRLTFATPVMREEKIARHAHVIALLAGSIFVVHPAQTEAVTYIWQRTASMAAFFYLASLCCYVKSRILQEEISALNLEKPYYIGSLILGLMAMFTKEFTMTLPLMVLFYENSFLKTKGNLNWKRLVPFFLTLMIVPLTILLTGAREEKLPADHISSLHYFMTQLRVMMTYIRLIFLPLHQNLDYDYPIYKSILELPVFISSLFLMIILFLAKNLFLKYRAVSFYIFWFFLTILPESSFLPFKDVIEEHRLYLPLAGYSIFLASSAYYLLGKKSISAMIIALSMLIVFYAVLTYQRNKVWRNEMTLWEDTASKSPHKARALLNRGYVYFKQGNLDGAMADFNKSIAIEPGTPEAYITRGALYQKEGKPTQSIIDYSKAIMVSPNNFKAYHNRALVYNELGNFSKAILDATMAVQISPDDPLGYTTRGFIFTQQGNFIRAVPDFNKSIELDPNDAEAHMCLGVIYGKQGHLDQALSEIKNAYEINPKIDTCSHQAFVISLIKEYYGRQR